MQAEWEDGDKLWGLKPGFVDLINIINNARCLNARTFVTLARFSFLAFRGYCKAFGKMLSGYSHNAAESLPDITLALTELRALAISMFTGKLQFHDEHLWSGCHMFAKGRPFHMPYNDCIGIYLSAQVHDSNEFMELLLTKALTDPLLVTQCKQNRETILELFQVYRDVRVS